MSTVERRYLSGGGDVYGKSYPTPQEEELLKDLKDLERKLKDRKRMNYSPEENERYIQDRLFEISEKFYVSNQPIVDALQEKIKQAEAKYFQQQEKNSTQNLLELRRWELRYSAMDADRLKAEAQNYVMNNEAWDVDRLTVLHKKLAEHGINELNAAEHFGGVDGEAAGPVQKKSFYDWVEAKNGWRPWEQSDPDTRRALQLYKQEFGKFHCLDESGQIWDFEIGKALETEEVI